jgi:hypothetical protein
LLADAQTEPLQLRLVSRAPDERSTVMMATLLALNTVALVFNTIVLIVVG